MFYFIVVFKNNISNSTQRLDESPDSSQSVLQAGVNPHPELTYLVIGRISHSDLSAIGYCITSSILLIIHRVY
jgi:hypothetical protein